MAVNVQNHTLKALEIMLEVRNDPEHAHIKSEVQACIDSLIDVMQANRMLNQR